MAEIKELDDGRYVRDVIYNLKLKHEKLITIHQKAIEEVQRLWKKLI